MKVKIRIILTFFLLLILYLGLGYRLFYIQIANHKKFKQIAKSNYSVQVNNISPFRGEICDRNGIPFAINRHTYSVGFNFKHSMVSGEMERDVLDLLGVSLGSDGKDSGFKWLARHITPEVASLLFKYQKDDLILIKENSRFFPQAPLASQVIGCVGTDNQGLSGIEYNFDKKLKDMVVNQELLRDAKGRIVYIPTGGEIKEGSAGAVYLTLDLSLQYIAERELKRGFKKHRPRWALAIIQDPRNGEILAMAQYPTFNNNLGVPGNVEDLKNKAVSNIFEPGSTFKVVTAAAALEEHVVKKDEMINCEGGEFEVGGFPIRDFEPHDFLNFEDCLVHSSNIALAKIGGRLKRKLLFKYARDFGFGNFTGIRLPGETRGILRKPDRWSGTSLSRISFGQEIGVTAVQLAGAFSTIANGGVLYEPRIIKKIEVKGRTREFEPLPIRRVISEETAKELTRILKEVVRRGSGKKAQVKGFSAAGKTGTAQKYDPETQTYKDGQYVALFGGFIPADNPRLTIIVVFDEPSVSFHWGGYVAAPVFSSIASASLNYLNIPPTEKVKFKNENEK